MILLETYENLIERYGKPILELDLIKNREMTIEEENDGMPSKISIFKNIKNQIGYTICSKYSEWHINDCAIWALKYILDETEKF